MIPTEWLIILCPGAIVLGFLIGIVTQKKPKMPEKSQRDKDIEELLGKVNKLINQEKNHD